MAVERLTDYTRRIWTALDADAPEDHDIQVGDVIYYMDSSTCGIVTYVYPEGSIDIETLPDVGGGGGGSSVELLASGTFTQTSSASGVNIPVSFDGTLFSYFVFSDVSNIAHTHAWYRNVENVPLVTPELTQLTTANYRDANNVDHLVSVMATNNSIIYYSEPNIHINQYSNNYPIRAGEYTWKVWGYTS